MGTLNRSNQSEQSIKTTSLPVPLPVKRGIEKLGNDISLARRRRQIKQASLAERIGASISTVRRMENGDLRVPLHFFARVLYLFGELEKLTNLLDTAHDDIGLMLMDEQLPKRVRSKKVPPTGAL
ncbi:MAG: helix-turn-helix domain-containing protein [Anaerolineae bacterium]|nr:helix-turn-helix domain-containing protein [Gloeobacterales cyanobacterium ES-bin-313]